MQPTFFLTSPCTRQQLKQAKMDVEMAKAQRNVDNPGLRQRKPTTGGETTTEATANLPPSVSPKQFTLFHLVIAAVAFYLLGRFYQTAA